MRARRTTVALATAAIASGVWTVPPSHAQDTTAVVVTTHDGLDMFRLIFQVRRASGDVVDGTNAAVAYSSCTDCQAVAIAFQILLAGDGSSTVSPENLALAINQECTLCVSFASAYQFVLANGDGPIIFTADGNQALAQIRARLQQLRGEDLSPEELDAELDAIADEIRVILTTQTVSAGAPEASPTPTTSATPTSSTDPTEPSSTDTTPTDSSSETETSTATETATESETATPSETATSESATPSPSESTGASETASPSAG